MDLNKITTPTLLLDPAIAKANIRRINERCLKSGVLFRPHFKTHQSKKIGGWFRDEGIDSIAVSSLSMARWFASDGWNDITIAFPYNPREHKGIDALARQTSLTLTIPSYESASLLAANATFKAGVMIKIDAGYNRSGTRWDNLKEINKITEVIASNPGLRLKGFLTHAGDTYKALSAKDVIDRYNLSVKRVESVRKSVRESVVNSDLILSVGDTPSASLLTHYSDVDEIRAGNFVFYDLMQLTSGACSFEDIAAIMACPVVDVRHSEKSVVIFGGAVHLSKESVSVNGRTVFGMVVKLTEKGWSKPSSSLYITSLSQEHGIINTEDQGFADFKVGELIGIVPVHSCLTADLAGRYLLTDGTRADHLSYKSFGQEK